MFHGKVYNGLLYAEVDVKFARCTVLVWCWVAWLYTNGLIVKYASQIIGKTPNDWAMSRSVSEGCSFYVEVVSADYSGSGVL